MCQFDSHEDLHRRLCSGDPTAPAEFAEYWLDRLFRRLQRAYPQVPEELVADAVTDTIMDVILHPSRYDPCRGSLESYLWMSARADLKNILERRHRQGSREVPTDPVELLTHERNFKMEERAGEPVEDPMGYEVLGTVFDPLDREVLKLMINEERRTEVYAKALQITDRPLAEQRAIVKRHKDRLKKRLRRLRRQYREGTDLR